MCITSEARVCWVLGKRMEMKTHVKTGYLQRKGFRGEACGSDLKDRLRRG